MSRIGKKPVVIPSGVSVTKNKSEITVKGPQGTLTMTHRPEVEVAVEDGVVHVSVVSTDRNARAYFGMTRALINNMIIGTSKGFSKQLDVSGVGYRADVKGNELVLNLGFTHTINYPIPAGVKVEVDKNNRITISGCDKQKVGQMAAEVRAYKPADPYKLKGVKYVDEVVKRKVGKAGTK